MSLTSAETDVITITNAAAQKIYDLIIENNNDKLKLRIAIQGGGCSGFKYDFGLEELIEEEDTVVEKQISDSPHKIQVLIDPMSYQYLMGAEIDYREDLQGAQFVIRNPNAKTKCGCGSSFGV